MQQIDRIIIEWIRETLVQDWLTPIFKGITFFGEYGIGWILLALIFLCFKKTRRIGWTMGIALLLGVLLGEVALKNIIARLFKIILNYHFIVCLGIKIRS